MAEDGQPTTGPDVGGEGPPGQGGEGHGQDGLLVNQQHGDQVGEEWGRGMIQTHLDQEVKLEQKCEATFQYFHTNLNPFPIHVKLLGYSLKSFGPSEVPGTSGAT